MLDEQLGEKTGSEANGPQLTRKKDLFGGTFIGNGILYFL